MKHVNPSPQNSATSLSPSSSTGTRKYPKFRLPFQNTNEIAVMLDKPVSVSVPSSQSVSTLHGTLSFHQFNLHLGPLSMPPPSLCQSCHLSSLLARNSSLLVLVRQWIRWLRRMESLLKISWLGMLILIKLTLLLGRDTGSVLVLRYLGGSLEGSVINVQSYSLSTMKFVRTVLKVRIGIVRLWGEISQSAMKFVLVLKTCILAIYKETERAVLFSVLMRQYVYACLGLAHFVFHYITKKLSQNYYFILRVIHATNFT